MCIQSIDKVKCDLWDRTLRDKGWGDLTHVSPCFMNSYTCMDSQGVLSGVNDAVRGMTENPEVDPCAASSPVDASDRHGQPCMAIQRCGHWCRKPVQKHSEG